MVNGMFVMFRDYVVITEESSVITTLHLMQSVATAYCFVDAARSGCNIKTVYFDTIKNVNKLDIGPPEIVTTEFRKVSTSRMKLVSSMPVPTGIMGEQRQHLVKQKHIVLMYQCSFMLLFETAISSAPNVPPSDHAAPIVVVIDGVRDPGEKGSLLRSASAVGCHVVITMQGLHRRMYVIREFHVIITFLFNLLYKVAWMFGTARCCEQVVELISTCQS